LSVPGPGSNLLLVAETGKSPLKVATGEFKEKLEYTRGNGFLEDGASFRLAGNSLKATQAEDLYWQASTRGGRAVQAILDGKAEFKDAAGTVGNTALAAGALTGYAAALSGNRNAAIAGGILLLVGAIAKVAEAATRPEADVRYWDNLPDGLYLATTKVDGALDTVDVQFLDSRGEPVGASRPVKVTGAGACKLGWVRSESALAIPDSAPGAIARK
jgi:hypothetical protein